MRRLLLLFLPLALFTAASPYLERHAVDEDYSIQFATSGAQGNLYGLDGTVRFDASAPEQSEIDVTVDVSTIDTGNSRKNKHARNDSWFAAETYPTIRFVAQQIKPTGSTYAATGQLTLHGVTREVTIPFTTETSGGQTFLSGQFTVDRYDYGIDGPFLLGGTVGDEVEVTLRVPAE